MKIQVNGLEKKFEVSELSLSQLIEKLALTKKKFAIEYNGEIIPRGSFSQIILKDGDKLEVVIAVGGVKNEIR